MEGLRSTEQSTLTLATISAQSLPQGNSHQKGHIYKLGGVVFRFSCSGQTNQPIRVQTAFMEVCVSAGRVFVSHMEMSQNNHKQSSSPAHTSSAKGIFT